MVKSPQNYGISADKIIVGNGADRIIIYTLPYIKA